MMAIAELIAKYNNGERSRELELALVNHLDTPKEILEQLAGNEDEEIAEAASLHVNLAGEITEGWYKLAESLIAQKDLGQNDLLIYELLEFAPVPDYFIKELCSLLIDPPITSESINRCQLLLEWLQNTCEILEAYQINFHKQENIFQIVIGKTKDRK